MADRLLLVEDDAGIAQVLAAALGEEGFAVDRCESVSERNALLAHTVYDVMLTDVILTDGDGISSLDQVREMRPDMPIIILSAQNTLDTAVRASGTQAFEYFPKPFDLDEVVRAAVQAAHREKVEAGSGDERIEGMPLIGRSTAMQGVFRMIARVLNNDLSVLVTGESGTGKELVAEAIHQLGNRSAGPFVAVNAAAIPAELIESELFGHEKGAFTGATARHIGKFEQASGGTLFLDEIGDMPQDAQTRLLRALQSGSIRRVGGREEIAVDARIVAATNQDLSAMIAAGSFREDLYYRLNVVPIALPPLRARPEDIPTLARHFLQIAGDEGLPRRVLREEAASLLSAQPWRGNVRELRNFLYRAALVSRDDTIGPELISELLAEHSDALSPVPRGESIGDAVLSWIADTKPADGTWHQSAIDAVEKKLFEYALEQTEGNQVQAASKLGINRNTLRKHLTELDIDPDRFVR